MEQFDLEEFAKMFDAALASDNPAVKKALRNFMMVAAIVHAEDGTQRIAGPLETLITKVNHLESMIKELQNNRTYRDYKDKYYQDWVYSPNTSTTSSAGYYGSSVDKVWTDDLESTMIKQLMKDLKFDDK